MKKMRLERAIHLAARPERKSQLGLFPFDYVVGLQEHITNRQVPIVVHVIDKMIYIIRTGFIRMHFRNFEFPGEKRHVAAHQFISHLDCESDRAGVSDSFILAQRVAATTIFNLPPMTCAGLLRLAIELPRAAAGHIEFCIDLAATGDWSIDTQVQFGHPTKDLEIFFV